MSTLQKTISDTEDIKFDWVAEAITIGAEVSFDQINYLEAAGLVEREDGNRWIFRYSPLDRPTSASTVVYRFTDNAGNSDTLSVNYTEPIVNPNTENNLVLSQYGPKRVKTKQMEIEQFDPRILDELEERKSRRSAGLPTFCSSNFCVGRTDEESSKCYRQ